MTKSDQNETHALPEENRHKAISLLQLILHGDKDFFDRKAAQELIRLIPRDEQAPFFRSLFPFTLKIRAINGPKKNNTQNTASADDTIIWSFNSASEGKSYSVGQHKIRHVWGALIISESNSHTEEDQSECHALLKYDTSISAAFQDNKIPLQLKMYVEKSLKFSFLQDSQKHAGVISGSFINWKKPTPLPSPYF